VCGEGFVARFLHQLWLYSRRMGVCKKLICGAIPQSISETELFGYYESGESTGAVIKGKPGLMGLADRGYFLLDEIGELPMIFAG